MHIGKPIHSSMRYHPRKRRSRRGQHVELLLFRKFGEHACAAFGCQGHASREGAERVVLARRCSTCSGAGLTLIEVCEAPVRFGTARVLASAWP